MARRGAETLARSALLRRAGGRVDRGAERSPHRDGGRADAARAAVHEHGFAGLQPAPLEDVRPDGEERLGEGGRLDHGEAAWHGKALHGRGRAVLGVPAARDERAHRIAHAPVARRRADGHDRARHLETRRVRSAGRRRVLPCRCIRSGRFTPAAATRISTSPAPMPGTGCGRGSSTSGPPGARIAMAVIDAGGCPVTGTAARWWESGTR